MDNNFEYRVYLKSLSKQFPTIADAATEIINLQAILSLPKGTEHFLTDVHGEYEAFQHVLKNASGAVKRKVNEIFGNTLREAEKKEICTLIYYPEEKLQLVKAREKDLDDWYLITLNQLVKVCQNVSSKYTRSKVRKKMPKEFAYIIDELAQRSSDDGEPSGTAGLPMLEVLRKNQLSGVAAVVTRYFGGIKLGAGGLVRAYTGSVSKAVQSCGLARKILMGTFALSADAADAGKLLNIIYQQQLFTVASVEYGQQARILLYMKQEQQDEAERWLTEALNTATQLEQVGSEYVEVPAEREK